MENNMEIVKNNELTLVDFWAPWCGPCKMLTPVIDELAKDYNVEKINVDDNQNLAIQYGVMSVPTLILFKDKKEIKRLSGFQPKDVLVNLLESSK